MFLIFFLKATLCWQIFQFLFPIEFRAPNDILVPPELSKEIQELLEYEVIPYEVLIWDLEKAIKYENPIMSRRQRFELEREQGHPMTWFRYHNFEDIAIYMDYLQITYPDIVELIHIGRSFEGRPLIVVKVNWLNFFHLKSLEQKRE